MLEKGLRRKRILKITYGVIFLSILIAWILDSIVYNHVDDVPGDCMVLTKWQYVETDGSLTNVDLPGDLKKASGEEVIIQTVIPDYVTDEDYIMIQNVRDITVTVDGEIRFEFKPADVAIPGGVIKNLPQFIKLYRTDVGKTVRISRHSAILPNGQFYEILLGNSYGIIEHQMRRNAIPIIGIITLTIFSIAFILVGYAMRFLFSRIMKLTAMSWGILVAALWLSFDSEVFSFIFHTYYSDGPMSYIMALLMPFPFLVYLDKLHGGRYYKKYLVLEVADLIAFSVFTFLHFFEIASFRRMMVFIDITIMIIALFTAAIVIYDIHKGHMEEYKYMVYSFCVFIIFCVIELISANTRFSAVDGKFLVVALVVLLAGAFGQQIHDLNLSEIERRKAIEASISKSNFLANMSHEIRTPINSVIGMNEMILRENNDPKIQEYARHVERSGKLLLDLVNDVLDFSRIEAGKIDIANREYSVLNMLLALTGLLRERTDNKGLMVKIDVAPDVPKFLIGDEIHLKQVVLNLISNAVKYTPKGSIGFSVECEKGVNPAQVFIIFKVSDTGVGIREEEVPKLFDAFVRADIQKNRSIEGTGLGLSIVKKLVDAMDGEITVESVYSKGSTFSVRLPQKLSDDTSKIGVFKEVSNDNKENEGKPYHEAFRAPTARMLAVDDNKVNLIIIKNLLKKTDMEIDLATGGEEAQMRCRDMKFDIILMDHMMPKPDGIAAMHFIKEDSIGLNNKTPVIVLTANAVAGCREKYVEEGFVDYISKPVDPEKLEKLVMQYLPKDKLILEKTDEQ